MDLSVLIVDDEPEVSELIARRIKKEASGISITIVENGLKCMEHLESNQVDCILSDYQMPGMDGMKLLETLRSQGNTTPFIFITAQGNEDVARQAFKSGAYDYFTKDGGFAQFARITNSIFQAVRRHRIEKSRLNTVEALKKSEERMFKAQEMAHVGNWELDIASGQLYWSDEMYRIYGREPESFVPTFEAVKEAMHLDDLEPFLRAIKAANEERVPLDMDYRLIRPDGTVRTVHTLGAVTLDDTGKPLKEAGTLQDITERKRMEETLLNNERFLSDMFTSIQDGISVIDEDLNIIRVNPTIERWFGYAMPIVGKKCYEVFRNQKDRCETCYSFDEHTGSGLKPIELPKLGPGGETTGWLEVHNFPFFDHAHNRPQGVIKYWRDITEQKRMYDSSMLFRNLLDRSNDAIFVNDPATGRFLFVNDKACNSLGYTRDELLKLRTLDIEANFSDQAAWDTHVNEVKSRKAMLLEGVNLRRDGSSFPVEVSVSYMTLGDSDYMVAVLRDITERKAIETDREALLEVLRHDMKTPITVIRGSAEMALSEGEGALGKEMFGTLESIHASATHLGRMLEDQVVMFSIGATGIRGRREKVDLCEMLMEASLSIIELARKKGLSFKHSIPEGLPQIVADRSHLLRAVSNLAQNAVNYTPAGGSVKLTADLSVCGCGDCVCISVTDDGPGIPEDERGRIFDKYYRSAGTSGTKDTGLGLAIVKAVAESHGGKVELKSEPGKGSAFTLVLPVSL